MVHIKSSLSLFVFIFLSQVTFSNDVITASIRDVVSGFLESEKIILSDEFIFSPISVLEFYSNREMKPTWINETGLKINGLKAINFMANIDKDGLDPDDYHYQKILTLKKTIGKETLILEEFERLNAHLEILLTDGFLMLSSHINIGKLNPKTFLPEWTVQRERAGINYVNYLQNALKNNSLEEDFIKLFPNQERYNQLKLHLASMKLIESDGGWEELIIGTKLELDSIDIRVNELRKRLRIEGYLTSDTTEQELFDRELESVIKTYQTNNGLESDGIVGGATIRSLNVSIEKRINQIILNLERWRWYEASLKSDHLRVNITNYNLEFIETQKIVFECNAIVGKTKRKTPEFNSTLKYIVINPYWRVPSGILTKDIIPAVKKDSSYLDKKRIRVLKGDSIIDSKMINWQTENIWQYTYRQDPGKYNSMGLIKFMFPNSHNVYIHDTPSKSLFERTERTFSSGCIRIQKPIQLAEFLLKDQDDWDLDKIMQKLKDGDPSVTVDLEEQIPVRILYYTAWGERGEKLQFRKDIYKKDAMCLERIKDQSTKALISKIQVNSTCFP